MFVMCFLLCIAVCIRYYNGVGLCGEILCCFARLGCVLCISIDILGQKIDYFRKIR